MSEDSKNPIPQRDDDKKPVSVNDSCIGCGICATIAPDIFEMNAETGKSEVKADANLKDLTKPKEAAAACPVQAIAVNEQ